MNFYRCHWRNMPEVSAFVAAKTRGKAKRCLFDHVSGVFPGAEFVDCYARRSTRVEEFNIKHGWIVINLFHPDGNEDILQEWHDK